MRIENYINLKGNDGYSGLFFAMGSFGIIDGSVEVEKSFDGEKTVYTYKDEQIILRAVFEKNEHGVVCRRDTLENISGKEITVNACLSRFTLDGSEYEVYTQYNGWQRESFGGWQKLTTQIKAEALGIRTCDGATPIMGFHNKFTGKNTVFHLIPSAKWEMSAKKFPVTGKEAVIFEAGISGTGLSLTVFPEEKIKLPEIIFFDAESKTDLDAYKLHFYYNKAYPRRSLPVLYNSWLYCFDNIDIDELIKQADAAADMGIEAFMIDAGWFGKGKDWWASVGDWSENMTSGPAGRLLELSEHVRARGMIFGLWFEPERAATTSLALQEHPDYYLDKGLLNFANPEAVKFIFNKICAQIDKYKIGWLKFDFNDTICCDLSGNGFYRYMMGQREFIAKLRARYPDIYITNCASGGGRMELSQGMIFDSFWLSDNQGPYEGLRIVKDTLKRMPPSLIERWCVQKYCHDLPAPYSKRGNGRRDGMIHCNNGTWDFLIGIEDSFSEEFLKGGPFGFSCDIAEFGEEYKNRWKSVIENYKKSRNFFKNASARILVDNDSVTVIEYSDSKFERFYIQIFTRTVYSNELVIYPKVDASFEYLCGEEKNTGDEILSDGIFIDSLQDNSCRIIELYRT